jgi:hypothetical protein
MIRYIEQRSNAEHVYFSAADQQAGCGIGHWRVTHEYASENTFAQEIRIEWVPDGVAVVWDPDAVRNDRSDGQYVFVPVDMARRKFERKWPDATPDSLSPNTPAAFTAWVSDDYVRIAEWFYIDPEEKLLALYPGGAIDDVTDDENAQQLAKAAGAQLEPRDGHCVWRALITANEIIEGPEKWPGPDIPIVPLIGEEVQIGRATIRRGVVRVLRDAQRIYNYGISTKTELIALSPKSPWIGTQAQFEKYQADWETANRRNHPYLQYTPQSGVPPPQRNNPSTNTQSLDGLLVEMQGAMNATTGIYPASLGAKSNETSGIAIRARQNEGDTGTFVYISNFKGALQRTGQIIVNMIPQIYDTKRTIQIAGEDGKIDRMPINQPGFNQEGSGPGIGLNDVTVGAYQVAVDMGASYSTKREEARDGMTELMRTLGPQGAVMFMDLFIKAQDWPLADKIAERARFLLPPQIQQQEAAESGQPPPPPPPPQPPTPEQQQAMALEQQKAAEQQQKNIETARGNEIADKQLQLDIAKFQFEQQTLPKIAQLEDQIRAEQVRNASLTLQLEATKVGHEKETGTLHFKNIELGHDLIKGAEQSDAALAEEAQKNITDIRKTEVASRGHDVELQRIALEGEKLRHGANLTAQEAQQANIEKARENTAKERANEIAARQHGLAMMDIGVKAKQAERDDVRGQREHEIAMNPPPAAKPIMPAETQSTASPSTGGGDAGHGQAIDEIKHVVSDLSEKVHGKPDYTPHILEVLNKLANQRKPIAAKRTPDGLRLVFDEAAPPGQRPE